MAKNTLIPDDECVARLIVKSPKVEGEKKAIFTTFDHLFLKVHKNEMSVLRQGHPDFKKDYDTTIGQLKSECLGYISANVGEIHKEIVEFKGNCFGFNVVNTGSRKKRSHADIRWKDIPEEISDTLKNIVRRQLRKKFSEEIILHPSD